MHSEVLVEKCVGDCYGIGAEVLLGDSEDVFAGGHSARNGKGGVAVLYNASGQKSHELV